MKEVAHLGYDAYRERYKDFVERLLANDAPLPQWNDLSETPKNAWRAAVDVILEETL